MVRAWTSDESEPAPLWWRNSTFVGRLPSRVPSWVLWTDRMVPMPLSAAWARRASSSVRGLMFFLHCVVATMPRPSASMAARDAPAKAPRLVWDTSPYVLMRLSIPTMAMRRSSRSSSWVI